MKIINKVKPALFNEINKQLGGLYPNEIGDYKFVKFMLGNSLRIVFNELKNVEPKTEDTFIMSKLIYEFEKDKQLFELGDLLESYNPQKNTTIPIINTHDLNKKINEWRHDPKWKEKFLSSQDMKT